MFTAWLQKGNALTRKGDLSEALESYFQAAEIASKEKTNFKLGLVKIAIADVYSIMENHENAVFYYKEAITIHKNNDSLQYLASALEILPC